MTLNQSKTKSWFQFLYGLLSVLMLLALLAFGFATWRDVETQANQILTPHNATLSSVVGRFFQHQDKLLGGLAGSILSEKNEDGVVQTRLNDVLLATPQMRVLAVIDIKGRVLATTGNLQTLEWRDLFDAEQQTIGRPFRPTFVSETLLPMRKAIINERGGRIGYVVAAYRLLGNNAIWQEAEESERNRRSLVVGDDGRVYLSYPESDTFWQSFVSSKVEENFLNRLKELVEDKSRSQSSTVSYQDEELLITASRLDEYGLFIVSGIQNADLLSLWFERMKFVTLAVLIFLVTGLFVFRVILHRATKFESARNEAESNVFKLSKAIDQSPSSVIVTDEHWLVEYANKRLSDGSQEPIQIEPGQALLESFPHNLLQAEVKAISEHLAHGGSWYGERRAKEQKLWFSFSISSMHNDKGDVNNYVIVTQDITERKQAEVRLYKQANFDALTGLPNRRRTHDLLGEALKNAWKNSSNIAVLYMDVDNFKQINDTFGHLLGDQMLQLIAVRLQQIVGQDAVACHMSGDEFLVFMNFTSDEDVIAMAEKIMDVMKQPVLLESKRLFISMSVGVSRYPEDSDDVLGLLKHADIALYESKNKGRRCYSFFSKELDARNKRKVELETEIRHALANKELFMVYQTKNLIGNEEVYGFEALMRWQSPRLGFVSPEEFITAAEEIGVIDQLGEFALIQACTDLKKYQTLVSQTLTMAVNVSMHQLTNSDIVATVERVIAETGINPSVLELEITESLLAQSLEEVQPVLNRLLELGVSLSIDDFGTGYSSLSYLTRFPVSALKIDRCFVKDMVENRSDATLTHTVITMAHKLGLRVVAEGIEDEDQLALLRVYGCDIGQGYFFTKPLNFNDMSTHLKGRQEKPDWAI